MPSDHHPPVAALPTDPVPAPRRRRRRVLLPVAAGLLAGLALAGLAISAGVSRARPASAPVPAAESGIAEAVAGAVGRVPEAPPVDESQRRREAHRGAIAAAREEIDEANRVIFALGKKHAAEVFRTTTRVLDWHSDLRHQPHPESVLFELSYGGCLPQYPRHLRRRAVWPTRSELEVALMQMRVVRAMPAEEARAVEEAFVRREAAEDRIRKSTRDAMGLGLIYDLPNGLEMVGPPPLPLPPLPLPPPPEGPPGPT